MNLLCKLGRHWWRYHGDPPDRRICFFCLRQETLVHNEWVRYSAHPDS